MRYMLLNFYDENISPELLVKEIPLWNEYIERLKKAGVFLSEEALKPTSNAFTLKGKGNSKYEISDGPYAELKEALGGFFLVDVLNFDEAAKWAAEQPHVKRGGSVEIRPVMEFEG